MKSIPVQKWGDRNFKNFLQLFALAIQVSLIPYKEVIEILGISRNTYYKYKKELLLSNIK